MPTACVPLAPLPRRLFRLSVAQWGNAVQALLSLPSAPALASRGGEAPFALFDDASLSVDAPMLYDLYDVLDGAAPHVDPLLTTALASCGAVNGDSAAGCVATFVKDFATRAFRRPLTDEELADLMAVYQQGATTSSSAGVELVVKAVLASPSFLFRTELGPRSLAADAQGRFPDTTLTSYEVASQLSFTLAGTLPDAPLMAAAADGSLASPEGIETQVRRLLALPTTQAYLTDVVLSWFGVGLLFEKTKDSSLLPFAPGELDLPALRNDLWTSARRFVSEILWSGSGKLAELLSSQAMFLNGRLARLYPDATPGPVPPGDATFAAATWPAAEGRSGLLTHPSFLWAMSDPSLASMVIRAKKIHDDVVCQDPVAPPIDLSTVAATQVLQCRSADGKKLLSTCDSETLRSDARLAEQPCKTCHEQLDPYARVLHGFGPLGDYRTKDEAGRAIDPVATFVGTQPPVAIPGVPGTIAVPGSPLAPQRVKGAQALAAALLASGTFDGCAAQRMLGVALGERIFTYDTCQLAPIRAASDGTITSLFINVMSPDFMRARAGGLP